MSDPTIRQLTGDEMLDAIYSLGGYSFSATPPFPEKAGFNEFIQGRSGMIVLAMCEDGRPVSVVGATDMLQQVRGKIYPCSGVWGVATEPAARRKGYVRSLIGRLLEHQHTAGQVFTTLYPFRESFYERLGYVGFPRMLMARMEPLALTPLLKQNFGPGAKVELSLLGDRFDDYLAYLKKMQQRTHGMLQPIEPNRIGASKNKSWLAQARVDGETIGVMVYRMKGEEDKPMSLFAYRFYSTCSLGRYLLLEWIARHADQAGEAELQLTPFERPESWLADLGVKVNTNDHAGMGRIQDLRELGGMQVGTGELTATVHDPLGLWNEATWRFQAENGVLMVNQAAPTEPVDCELTIQALTALVYGTHDPGDFSVRGWGNPTLEVQSRMRILFPALTPYLHEFF